MGTNILSRVSHAVRKRQAHARTLVRLTCCRLYCRRLRASPRKLLPAGDVHVIVVGGGACLTEKQLGGAHQVLQPHHGDVANAIGAAIPQVGFHFAVRGLGPEAGDLRLDDIVRGLSLAVQDCGICTLEPGSRPHPQHKDTTFCRHFYGSL